MRQRFMNVLENDDPDPCAEAALRGFWARIAPRAAATGGRAEAQVIDLARWASCRPKGTRL